MGQPFGWSATVVARLRFPRTVQTPLVELSAIGGGSMTAKAKPDRKGRRGAAGRPRETRFEGDRVRVRRAESGLIAKRVFRDVSEWFAELDRLAPEPFMPEDRQQPLTPQQNVRLPDR